MDPTGPQSSIDQGRTAAAHEVRWLRKVSTRPFVDLDVLVES